MTFAPSSTAFYRTCPETQAALHGPTRRSRAKTSLPRLTASASAASEEPKAMSESAACAC